MSARSDNAKIELDPDTLRRMAGLWVTVSEMATIFDCSEDTIRRRIKEYFGMRPEEFFAQQEKYTVNLVKRSLLKNALKKENTAAQIFILKSKAKWMEEQPHTVSTDDMQLLQELKEKLGNESKD